MLKPILVILGLSLMASASYYTSDIRTQSVYKMCEGFSDRAELVGGQSEKQNEGYKKFLEQQLTADGNQLILGLLDGSKGGVQALQEQSSELIAFVGPFVVGFVIILFMWMFLCCCCCCPSCCPSKCCQKPEDQAYSKCELLWPTITLILALLIIVVMSIIGITKAGDTVTAYKAMTCSASICLDDFINGNVSETGVFFVGLNPMAEMLADLRDNHMTTIQTSFSSIDSTPGTPTKQASDQGNTLLNEVSSIPTGTAGQTKASFTYNNFDGSSGTISSTFPNNLGGVVATSGRIWDFFTQVQSTNLKIDAIMTSADTFAASIAAFNSGISAALTSLNDVTESLQDTDSKMYDSLKMGLQPMEIASLAITIIFAVFLGFSIIGILGAILMSFCSKHSCRYLVYFSCFFLFFLGIFAFIVAILFSIFTPVIYYSCQFLNYSVESGDNFEQNFGQYIGEDTTSKIKICMPGESGQIISTVVPEIYDTLDSMQTVINGMADFNTILTLSTLQSRWNKLADLIQGNYRSTTLDFSSTTNRNILKNMANANTYSGCTSNSFSDDSWIPSIESGAVISCLSGTGVSVDDTTCDAAALVAGQDNAPNSCYGCIDSFLVLGQSSATIAADLKNRYTGGGECDDFADDMQLLWDNYYSVKVTEWDTSGLNTRYNAASTSYSDPTTGYYNLVNTVGSTFTTIQDSWVGSIETITDPEYGLVAGLNCLIFGQDFKLFINTTCMRLFNLIYMLRYTIGVSAMAILFSMCCATCSGVRYYKHSERTQKIKALNKTPNYDVDSSMINLQSKQSKRR